MVSVNNHNEIVKVEKLLHKKGGTAVYPALCTDISAEGVFILKERCSYKIKMHNKTRNAAAGKNFPL